MTQTKKRGFFITFEGGDGSGKSTQAKLLASWLKKKGHPVLLTREPGGTRLGEQIRKELLSTSRLDPWAELFLFQALRAQHVAEVIRPALGKGKIVICDRFFDSTMAYQGYGLGLDRDFIAQSSEAATQGLAPDLTLILELPAQACLRKAVIKQRMERRGISYQQKVLRGFAEIARKNRRCVPLCAMANPRETHAVIQSVVENVLQRRRRA